MTGEELLDDIIDIIQDSAYDRDKCLGFANRGLKAVAGRVLLPGLADGVGEVTTATNANTVALPTDYHRGLFSAAIAGKKLAILPNLAAMNTAGYRLDTTTGAAVIVTTVGGKLLYQQVPGVATVISLRYYRKPLAMSDSGNTPDGIDGHPEMADWLDQALVSYTCSQIFSRIEQGLEGNKVDTAYHSGRFEMAIVELSKLAEMTVAQPPPTICRMERP